MYVLHVHCTQLCVNPLSSDHSIPALHIGDEHILLLPVPRPSW